MSNKDILIVDDEMDIRNLLGDILQDEGYGVRLAANSDEVFVELNKRCPSLILLDIWLEKSSLDGLEILKHVKEYYANVAVVVMSGHSTIETAVSAIKLGAYDFIVKPFDTDRLLFMLDRAIELSSLQQENSELRVKYSRETALVGVSAAMVGLRRCLGKVAPTNSRVLIEGEAGTGKEVVARLLHSMSGRSGGSFVTISAAILEPDSFERELFGQEIDGQVVVGTLERAHGGTLFIDEVGDMPTATQAKILRILTDQTFYRVGGVTSVKVDVRFVSASNQSLRKLIDNAQFREDLYHRLSVVPIFIPPLRDRIEDIPELVLFFIKRIVEQTGLLPRTIPEEIIMIMQSYAWPGNVRQLRNLIERLMIMCDDSGNIDQHLLPEEFRNIVTGVIYSEGVEKVMNLPLRQARNVFEREYLVAQINRFGGNISRMAHFVGMERSALHRKLKSLEIDSIEYETLQSK